MSDLLHCSRYRGYGPTEHFDTLRDLQSAERKCVYHTSGRRVHFMSVRRCQLAEHCCCAAKSKLSRILLFAFKFVALAPGRCESYTFGSEFHGVPLLGTFLQHYQGKLTPGYNLDSTSKEHNCLEALQQ